MGTLTEQRMIAESQVGFRETNERIEATADSVPMMGLIPFVCECPELGCSETVRLTFDEYEEIRAHPRRFFNVPGHERNSVAAEAEVVLIVFDRFTVVEKIGMAGEIATATHTGSR
jgi:hypothetical protein